MSNHEVTVADSIRPYLNEIADRLWSGHATIMVGSGFSKNAKPNNASCSKFPDWAELGDIFYKKVHGKLSGNNKKYMNVLKLADEVHAAFGRPVLDQLLRQAIPDLDYEPSELHRKLLNLPWTDVFTTNYDTLLERATASAPFQYFDVVVNKEDLVYSKKPRIIKLHGSFPSDRPFVITEEDYRRYPREFAPFVNTVQQSLLENTLCLVGFSGDDPNFLQWIGWIRDNLGQRNSPNIYLVGVINLSDVQKKLLENKNIVVVNMAECADIGNLGYHQGLEKFFDYLDSKNNSRNAFGWPFTGSKFSPDLNIDKAQQLEDTLKAWKTQRESYPGWVVVPEDHRNTLWHYTEHWCNFLNEDNDVSDKKDLEWVYELVWRMDKSLHPIFNDQAPFFSKVLDKYKWMLFPENGVNAQGCNSATSEEKQMWLDLKISLLRFYREEGSKEEWKRSNEEILSIWDELSVLQQAHVYYERSLFALFNADVPALRERISEWFVNESLPFMEAKRAMLLAEIGNVKEAAIILSDALERIRSKLNLKPISNDYSLVSQESYVMLLYKFVRDSASFHLDPTKANDNEIKEMKRLHLSKRKNETKQGNAMPSDIQKTTRELGAGTTSPEEEWTIIYKNLDGDKEFEYNSLLHEIRYNKRADEIKTYQDRWHSLKQYKCDPWNEIKIFSGQLKQAPIKRESVSETCGFDIGHVVLRTQNFGGGDREAFVGYTFLRFIEDSGSVFRIPVCSFEKKSGEGAIARISNYSPYWATATLLRVGELKFVELLYSRASLSKISQQHVDYLVDHYLNILTRAQKDIAEGNMFYHSNFGISLAKVVPDILSRLCTKCSNDKRFDLLKFLKSVYESADRGGYDKIISFTERLVKSFDKSHKVELVSILLDFPVPENLSLIEERELINPLFFVEIDIESSQILQPPTDRTFDFLVDKAASSNQIIRSWSILSLGKLYEWELLNEKQKAEFGQALWKRLDESNMPTETGYYKFAFLKMPHPPEVSPKEKFKMYIDKTEFPIQGKKTEKVVSIAITGGQVPLCHEICGASELLEWSKEDIIQITERIAEWWDRDKDYLVRDSKPNPTWGDTLSEFKGRFSKMENVLARVIVPEAEKQKLTDLTATVQRILSELNERNIPALRLRVALSVNIPDEIDHLFDEIEDNISSDVHDDVIEAIYAIDFIVEKKVVTEHDSIISKTMTLLSQKIRWRHTKKLAFALNVMANLVKEYGSLFINEVEGSTLSGLHRIVNETKYDCSESELAERIYIRQEAAGLAAAIYSTYTDIGKQIPKSIQDWQNICLSSDEFIEIKNAWVNRS